MKHFFEVSLKYDKTGDDGIIKTVIEKYLLDAMSFTEAEAKAIEKVTPYIRGEFTITAIKRTKIAELFDCEDLEADRWYSCKVNFIALDEEKGTEKKTAHTMYIRASSTQTADERLRTELRISLADYEIENIKETKILEVW